MAFTQKSIEVDIELQDGGGKTFRDFACECTIEKVGLPDKNKASVTIYGISLEDMEQFTVLAFRPLEYRKNKMRIRAGDKGGNVAQVFVGDIMSAFADFGNAPNVCFRVEAQTGLFAALTPSDPETVQGEAKASDIISKVAGETGFGFTSSGDESVQLRDTVLQGTPWDKAAAAAQQVGRELIVDDETMVLIDDTGMRLDANPVTLSPETGMIGYPSFTSEGISARSLFNPNIVYAAELNIQSVVPKSAGSWRIIKVVHNLSANKAGGGPWETAVEAVTRIV